MRKTSMSVSAIGAVLLALTGASASAEAPARPMHGGEGESLSQSFASVEVYQSRDIAQGGVGPQMAGAASLGATGGLGGLSGDGAGAVIASVAPTSPVQATLVRSAHTAGGANQLAGLDSNQLFALAGLTVSPTGLAVASPPNLPFNTGAHGGAEVAAAPVLAASTLADGVWRIGADAPNALVLAGLKPGDVVLSVNGVLPSAALPTLITQTASGPASLLVRRDGGAETLSVDPKAVADALARFQASGDGRS